MGYRLRHRADGGGRGHDGRVGPRTQLPVTRRLLHDVFHEELVDHVAGGPEVLFIHGGPDVVHYVKLGLLPKLLRHRIAGVLVAREDDGEPVPAAEAWLGVRGRDDLRHLGDMCDGSTVRAAGHEDHIGPKGADSSDALMGEAAIVVGQGVHDDGPRAQSGALGRLRRHLLDHARDHHLEAATGARGGDVEIDASSALALGLDDPLLVIQDGPSREFLHLLDGVQDPTRHILERRLHRGGRLAPHGKAVARGILLDENGLRRG